eukprot:TRINITY_DN167_c0_g1_i12.p1 TRINITY_DN167_c0_g1~~TRINITY_DN167_c0_g1_i12.p1  ORF type:complete len:243 (-),score=77.58 TRINITY_DN167_c0_g1_i12:101-760(-)
MIFFLLISLTASCLGQEAYPGDGAMLIPEVWEEPHLQPIMEQFKESVQRAQSTFIKQTLNSTEITVCPMMQEVLTLVTKARIALDCGSVAPSGPVGDELQEEILEATRSCVESEDDHCLVEKLANLMRSEGGVVCSALLEVENGLKTALDMFCHEELLGAGSSCSWWSCGTKVLSAGATCAIDIADPLALVGCVKEVIGAGSQCVPCICSILHISSKWC